MQVKQLSVSNEWDVDELREHFEQHQRVMVRAEFAGCGKSHACKAMEQRGHKVLFVCPTNKLVQNNKENGVTLNVFFGVGMTDDVTSKMSKFDDEKYDVIVFDEIYFANVRMLSKIKRYAEQNPNKIILATGDTNQLETIDLISNCLDYDTYMDHCIDTIFPNNIMLKENKRLKTPAEREKLRSFKEDIFNPDLEPHATMHKYFKKTGQLIADQGIAFRSSTCRTVSANLRKHRLNKTRPYEVGEKLVCRKFIKHKGMKLGVNYEYTIKSLSGQSMTLLDESSNTTYTIPTDLIQKHFIHSYCRTCHSFQGSTIDAAIMIFDWKFRHSSRKWLYTAVTRATSLNNVWLFDGQESNEIDDEIFNNYLNMKIFNYRKQDMKAGRPIPDNFITKEWLKQQFGKTCSDCGDCFAYEFCDGKVESNLSADRIDCNEAHHLNNITPLCVTCNQRKSCW